MQYEASVDHFIRIARRFVDEPAVLVEIGGRDCRETIRFHQLLPGVTIYTFECNPDTLPLCRQTVADIRSIHLVEKAVTDRAGQVRFLAIDPAGTETGWADGNPGASSLLRASSKYPVERYAQREIFVQATTLNDFMHEQHIHTIDLLWMDIQGAELSALHGLGLRIDDVRIMHLEVGFFPIYEGQPLFPELKRFLNAHGFLLVGFTTFGAYGADAVFVNRSALSNWSSLLRYRLLDSIAPLWNLLPALTSILRARYLIRNLIRR